MQLICLIFVCLALLSGCGQGVGEPGMKTSEEVSPVEIEASAEEKLVLENDVTIGEDIFTICRIGVDAGCCDWPVLDTVEIYRNGDFSAPIQMFADFTHDADPPLDGEFLTEDLNFDGWLDFRCFGGDARAGEWWYCWLWDPETEAFARYDMDQVREPVWDAENQLVYSTVYGGVWGFESSTWAWEDGELVCLRAFSTYWTWMPRCILLTATMSAKTVNCGSNKSGGAPARMEAPA